MRRLLAIFLTAILLAQPVQAAKRIAFTFDDVPRRPGGFMTPDQRTVALIAGLHEAGVEQAGFFVVTDHFEEDYGEGGEERVRAYVAAGHVIANHSHSHGWAHSTEIEDYVADIDQASELMAPLPGRRPWYRFPYLDEGRSEDRILALREALADRGLSNAYVTVDNYDWYIDNLAQQAVENGQVIDRDGLRDLFTETMVETANYYDRIALEAIDRSPAHVLLLHETDLAALYIVDLVNAFRADGWEIISIDEAYEDPINEIEPRTTFLGSGRIAAIRNTQGIHPRELVHERTDEAVLDELFAERVLIGGTDNAESAEE